MTIANAKPDLLITGPLGTTTVNAASSLWSAYTSVEAKITAAIAYAVSIGAKACYVPDCFLPYTASLVTFNPAVKMTREGGNPQFYDVMAYGADPTGVADATAAITGALNGATAGNSIYAPVGTFLVPGSGFTWNKPVNLLGEDEAGTVFKFTNTGGILGFLLSAPLITNTGSSARFMNFTLQGPGYGLGTGTALNVQTAPWAFEGITIIGWQTGETFGNNSFFISHRRCHFWQNTTHVNYPASLTNSGENMRYLDCEFVNVTGQATANGITLGSGGTANADFYFQNASFDSCQLVPQVVACTCVGCHFEVTNQNPALDYIVLVAGRLMIFGGQVNLNTNLTSFISAADTNDAGNAVLTVMGIHGFSSAAVPFIKVAGGVHAFISADVQGSWTSLVSGTTTGTLMVFGKNVSRGYARIITQSSGLSTASAVDVSVASFALPANLLAVNGQAVRLTMRGNAVTGAAIPNIKFGTTTIITGSVTAANVFDIDAIVTRTGAATQLAVGTLDNGTAIGVNSRTAPAETLANAITVDFRGSVAGGGTLNVDYVMIEVLES